MPLGISGRASVGLHLFSAHGEPRPKVLVLTSATPREGRAVLASNLSIALSEIHRQRFIDADLRKPRIRSLFE
jgi:Mrp family chromosome partitioning ATPase